MTYESVLGLDLSLTGTGMASVDFETGAIRTRTIKTQKRGYDRLDLIVATVTAAARTHDLVGIEGLSYGSKGSSFLDLAGLHHSVRLSLWRAQIPVVVVSPAVRMKYATGKGGRPRTQYTPGEWKRVVWREAARLFPSARLQGDDEADALLVAAVAARVAGVPFDRTPPPERYSAVNTMIVDRERGWPLP